MTIDQNSIEQALDYFENKRFSDTSEKEILKRFPEIMSYLTSNQFNVLSDDEYMILSFDILILLKIILDSNENPASVSNELIEANEAKNWEKFEKIGNIPFIEKAYRLFDKKNKDLSEYIISSFYDEENDEDEINIPAQEIILIAVKTIFDCFNS